MKENTDTKSTTSLIRTILYWVATAIIALETAVGSVWDIMRIPFVSNVMQQLGYPPYFLTIIGVWKVFAVIALLIPRFARLKEWTYAGLFFVYTGAAASHWAMSQHANVIGPLIFAGITIVSWALRPQARRELV